MTAGVGVYQLRELGEDFHHLVGTFTAGGHHNHIGIALLGYSVLQHGFSAAEGTGNEAGTAFGDGVHGIYHTNARFHNPVGARLLLVSLDGQFHGPFLGHGHGHFLAGFAYQGGNDGVYIVRSGFLYGFYGVCSPEGEGDHDFVGQPAFLHITQPVGGFHFVAGLGQGLEVPGFLAVQWLRVFASLEEHLRHGGQVVLQAVIHAGKQAGAQGNLQHLPFKFYGVTALEAAGALEHLHGSGVTVHFDDLCHELGAS